MLRFLLFPLAVLYDAVTSIRNKLYDRNYKPSTGFDVTVIGIGNLALGGTGKTPMVEYLIRLFTPGSKIATLSRGYGRTTKGFRVVTKNENPATVGDEPFQLFKKYGSAVTVVVGEERAFAIPNILDQYPNTNVILLDDAFQHRQVRPAFQILLTDFNRPFYHDYVVPAGRLRESRKGASRADVIIITKCPKDLTDEKSKDIEDLVRGYTAKPVFFTSIQYGTPIAFDHPHSLNNRVVLVSGIANSKQLEEYVTHHFKMVRHVDFRDHHVYTRKNILAICELAKKENAVILTTEKDAVKLMEPAFQDIVVQVPFFYLPIQMEFVKNGKEFDEMVRNVLNPVNVS